MKTFFTKLHYEKKPIFWEKALVQSLVPISFVYEKLSDIRNYLYKKNILKNYKPDVLTISIGNLTTGGTGKTPITAAIANNLTEKGYKVAILSRGYGSKLNSKKINIISDGNTIFYDANQGGDEPVWLAQNCPKTAVLTSSNRVNIAKYAEKELGCNALILDDGFQHQKLQRDINILVVDSIKQFGNKKVLPAGPLRESIKNISRANKIIIVNKGSCENLVNIDLKEYHICNLTTDYIYEIHSKTILENTNQQALAFSAIGQPQQFYNLAKENGLNIVKTINYADHHNYNEEDIKNIIKQATDKNIQVILTTEKDAVKIKQLTNHPIYALKLKSKLDLDEILKI